jgi:hypothetical protein
MRWPMRWLVGCVVATGCITGRGLSDDEQLPGNDDGFQSPTTSGSTLILQANDHNDTCGSSAPSFVASGGVGTITVAHRGAEMADCVGWAPAAVLEEGEVVVSYEADGDDSVCGGTCPFDFDFTISIAPGTYDVVWSDQSVTVTVD